MVQLLGRDRAEIAVSAARLYRGALAHIVLSLSRGEYSFMQDHEVANDVRDAIMSEALVDSSWLIPSDIVEGYSPAFIEAALASWMLRACVEYIPLERIAIHLTEYSDSLSISSWKLTSLLVCILAGISEEDIQSSYTYPKRLDTVGSVMTTYTTFNPPSLASQPAPPVVHSHPTSESIRAGPSNDTVVGVTYPFETMVHRLSVRPAGIGRPSQHIAAEQPEGQAFVGRSNFPGQVNVVASQPIVFEEPTKHPSSNSSSEPTKGDPPTGQTIQEAKIDSAARHAPIESPRNFSTAESMVVELPRGPTPPPHPIETFSTGQPVAARLGSSIPYTYPVSELEVFSRNDPPRRLNIAALRFAYTRDVGMTLSALELVAVNLAKQLYGGDFDCHRILLNILICVREVTINENRHPDTTIEDKFGLLGVAEQVLRIEGIHDEVRAAATRLRMDFVTMLRKHFVTGDLRSKIHPGLLILFGNFFFQLRARGESSRSSNQEDIVVLHLLGPLLQELYTYPTNVWEIQNVGLRHYEIAKLKNLCDEVRQVYYTFRAKVNRTSRTLQSDVRYSRHPEVSCCHRMDELNLCLPSQDFSELDRFPDHSFLPTMYDYGSLDDLVTPIWRVPLSPIASIYSRPILSSSPSQAPYASDSFLPAPVVAHSPLQLSDDEQSAHPDILTS
ncbi:hypothetical protein M407DRAFT_34338 [Tulasnella calospora MUT 4182]|uniref:Uncharacterized protein n=1 Tax=Tulasnella calospora MUT 4182 TaxID=1051891 RepID=A0A0C3Q0T8_9AGAM|nr:hypothetical protein M407DRAFT_34338 [Tulasnella calospora MUT 4182]